MPLNRHPGPTADLSSGEFVAISRRSALCNLAVAFAVLPAKELFADEGEPSPSLRPPKSPPIRFLDGAALRRAIRTAPVEFPGKPGLYSLDFAAGLGYPVIALATSLLFQRAPRTG